jgi:ACS family 4-hydroxyphenylacetate permease-like MFS transporter
MAEATRRGSKKAFRRLTVFLVLCYVVSYLDRINIGFANLTMAADLGLTATMFGIANSLFYVAYAAFEIPSNLMLARVGARMWIPRIMVTWGIASCLTMFAVDEYSLYILRFFVGAAEAGLLPGVILYLSYWFGREDRARANAIFVTGMPLAMLIGAPVSGLILEMDNFAGLAGWQWLFLLEGIPSIIIGITAYFFLVDRPSKATWLTQDERDGMEAAVAAENASGSQGSHSFTWKALASPTVILLAMAYFCNVASNNTIGTWSPLVVKEMLGNTDRMLLVGLVSAVAPLFAIAAIPLWSRSSDRSGERRFHLAAALGTAALGWLIVTASASPYLKLVGLTLASVGGFSFVAVFWALAIPLLNPASRPAAIGLISTSGLMASILSPSVVGVLRDFTHSFNSGFWYVAGLQMCGVIAIFAAVRITKRSRHN